MGHMTVNCETSERAVTGYNRMPATTRAQREREMTCKEAPTIHADTQGKKNIV